LITIAPNSGWIKGRYLVVAASTQAQLEWLAFATRNPEAARKAYERLSSNPLERQPRKQFPLRGEFFHPFWELEATPKERIWYAVDEVGFITIIAARDDIHLSPKLAKLIKNRRSAYSAAVEIVRRATRDTIDGYEKIPQRVRKGG
jgi:hypothetical protein